MRFRRDRFSAEAALDKGRELPEWATDPPALTPGEMFFFRAFLEDLSTTRQVGFSLGEVPWTAVMEYADRRGLDEEMAGVLWELVKRMDEAYREWYAPKKLKTEQGRPEGR